MFAEDLSLMFADFGQPATIGGTTVHAIFENGYSAASVGMLGMASATPTLTLPTAQVPANPIGQAVAVADRAYTVAEHQPDATGLSRLLLEVAA